ncbi:methyl-accepting chemotaxis protein [Sphingomonas hengshuiensis]|uniref:Chemotaxis protein n=1 Tax=Sphingomonas hengshuiensis TaxID=1609977 RepID=A0A7U4LF33_9SPHN|nr:methyl-accepting chemotaxis protein [Sphingomonas hengshuiensis]AJP72114.1 chemotaxis protein [Sphingomonas hengshuiensis]
MHWFETVAPIRLKTKTAFGSLVGLMALAMLVSLFGPNWVTIPIQLALIAAAAVLSHRFREAICVPYVNTVVRMEGLAAGDLTTPIAYTDYQDCVGRMTKAMYTFRDNAVEQQRQAVEQAEVVRTLGEHLGHLKQGDLTAEVTANFPGSYALLKSNFNDAIAALRTLIGSVMRSTTSIRAGSTQIASASDDLARRTEANAASLEQTVAAFTQMNQRLRATATAASETVLRADGAIATVSGGRSIADEAIQAMARVSESAKGIDSVIEGLDKIAFQTRVLAMNAAVEAGRAGEAGRGFAVVADLVSALAMRAEEEAGRARDQLTTTQTEVVAAVEMVGKVDAALANIAGDVGGVHELLGRIATDNQAQSAAVGEISTAIGAMDQSTQQNAAMVEQTSAAARNLDSEVVALAAQAAEFRIGDTGRVATGTRRHASAAYMHA